MSYARPTLISQIVQKGRKVSINPRNEDEAALIPGRDVPGGRATRLLSGPARGTTRNKTGKNDAVEDRKEGARARTLGILGRV